MEEAEEAELAWKHEAWFQQGRQSFEWDLKCLSSEGNFFINSRGFVLLTLERPLFELLQQTVNNLPARNEEIHDRRLTLNLQPLEFNRDCRTPPTDEALLATATELANLVDSSDWFRHLELTFVPADISATFLATFSRMEELTIYGCPLATANVRSMYSIKTLRQIQLYCVDLTNSEIVDAFCHGMKTTEFLEILEMEYVSFGPEHQEQAAAAALAYCKNLVTLLVKGVSQRFNYYYCVALSENFDTKLERLRLCQLDECQLDLNGEEGTACDLLVDAAVVAKIRNLLKWNVQRKTSPPLFAAIGRAGTDAKRKECLVEALEVVDTPVLFEYITANENNLIELMKRLGRGN